MAKKEILTSHQKQFLNFISGEQYIVNNFYLTEGTALSAFELGSRFLQAANVKDFPLMIRKINHREWQDFFTTNAKKLGAEIFI